MPKHQRKYKSTMRVPPFSILVLIGISRSPVLCSAQAVFGANEVANKLLTGQLRGFIKNVSNEGAPDAPVIVTLAPTPAATASASAASTTSSTSAKADGTASALTPTLAPTNIPTANSGRSGSSSIYTPEAAAELAASNDVGNADTLLFGEGSGRKLITNAFHETARNTASTASLAPTVSSTAASTSSSTGAETDAGRFGSSLISTSGSAADVTASNDVSNGKNTILFPPGSVRKLQLTVSNDLPLQLGQDVFTYESTGQGFFSSPNSSPSSAPSTAPSSTDFTNEDLSLASDVVTTSVNNNGAFPKIAASNDIDMLFHP